MSELIPLEAINPVQVFTVDGIDSLLTQIEEVANEFTPDISSAKGRAECKSMAYKITLSKGVIDRAGKELVADWKAKTKVVDESRKKARDFLDDLSARVRKPLTEWEEETARMQAEAEMKKKRDEDHAEALAMNDLFDREREVAAKEAEIRAEEEKRLQEQREREREAAAKEQAEAIRRAAEEKAKREAEKKVRQEQERADRLEREAKEAAERAEREKEKAVEEERRRLQKEQAERELAAKRAEEAAAEAERKRQEDQDHKREVNRKALADLMEQGIDEDAAKEFITLVYQGKISGMRMVY